jgi:hypothetical protein
LNNKPYWYIDFLVQERREREQEELEYAKEMADDEDDF